MTFTIDTRDFDDHETGTCAFNGGRDAVYQISLDAGRTLTVSGESPDGGTNDAVLFLRGNACRGDAGFPDAGIQLCGSSFSKALDAGNYFLFVDSYDSVSSGPTVVTVTLTP